MQKYGLPHYMSTILVRYFLFLTGFFDKKTAADMVKEGLKMEGFEHPHVLNIIGVCMDAGPAPYIIMPFIENGSLLDYIKREKLSWWYSMTQTMSWQVYINAYSI